MCPSYLATRDEKDSTRGRARVLQELANGSLVSGWDAARGRRGARPVPVLQGLLGRLPGRRGHGHLQGRGALPALPAAAAPRVALLARLAAPLGGPDRAVPVAGPAGERVAPGRRRSRRSPSASAASTSGATCRGSRRRASAGGSRRARPRGATARLRRPARPPARLPRGRARKPVLLWVDTFTNAFAPQVGQAAVAVLEAAGLRGPGHRPQRLLRPHLDLHRPAGRRPPPAPPDAARAAARARRGHPGRRPRAVLHRRAAQRRGRAAARRQARRRPGRRGQDPRRAADRHRRLDPARPVGRHRRGPAALPPARRPRLGRRRGAARARRARRSTRSAAAAAWRATSASSAATTTSPSPSPRPPCSPPCAAAGGSGATVLADGFSCRTQLDQLAGVRGTHLAELLAARLARTAPSRTASRAPRRPPGASSGCR